MDAELIELSLLTDNLVRLAERKTIKRIAGARYERLRAKMQNYINSDLRLRTQGRIREFGLTSPNIFEIDTEQALIMELVHPELRALAELGAKYGLDRVARMVGRPLHYALSREWLEDHAIKFSKKAGLRVAETMNERIRLFLADANERGLSVQESLTEMLKFWKDESEYRAEMVARTETRHSIVASEAEMEARMGITEWDWEGCHTECDICGPFIGANPHSRDEIDAFNEETHPNCIGQSSPKIPDNFMPGFDFLET